MKLLLAVHVFLVLFSKVLGGISKASLAEEAHLKVPGGKLRASRQETNLVAALQNENESVVAAHTTMEEYKTEKTKEQGRSLIDRVIQSFKGALGNRALYYDDNPTDDDFPGTNRTDDLLFDDFSV